MSLRCLGPFKREAFVLFVCDMYYVYNYTIHKNISEC
jgi:hypothetical protein